MRPEKRPHKSNASILTGKVSVCVVCIFGNKGVLSGAPVKADNSRAIPNTLKQCARLGVSFKVNKVSSKCKCSRMFCPKGASLVSSNKPPWSLAIFNSLAEQSMPSLSTPRSLPTLILKGLPSSPGGNSAPTMAQGTLIPTRALGAPHTMLSKLLCPTSTLQTRKRSASGCCTASLISPTTMPVNGGATGWSSSTSKPAIVKVSAKAWVEMGGLQNSRNQDSGNCISGSRVGMG